MAGDFVTDEYVHFQELAPAAEALLIGLVSCMEDGQAGDGMTSAEIVGAGAESFEVFERLLECGLAGNDFQGGVTGVHRDEIGFPVGGAVGSERLDAPMWIQVGCGAGDEIEDCELKP
jgi:hypothetical protein